MADLPDPLSTLTTYYGLTKPTVGGDNDAWGGEINNDLDIIDNQLHLISTSVPLAATSAPPADSAAGSVGTLTTKFALADHYHPTDATRAPLANPTFTGVVTIPSGAAIAGYATTASLPTNAGATPLADGTADPGIANTYAREGHVHPTDTTRYAASNPSGYQTAANVTALLPTATSTTPIVDGTAAVGSDPHWARGDHVHPTDLSRYAASNPNGYQNSAQVSAATANYVPLAGATMTGQLTLPATAPVGANDAPTKTYVDNAVAAATSSVITTTFVNKLRNGAMDIWSRGGTAPTVGNGIFTAAAHSADGWKAGVTSTSGAVVTPTLVAGIGQTVNALKLTAAANVTGLGLSQAIESYIAAPLANKTVLFQARIQNNSGNSLTPTVRTWIPNTADTFGTVYNSPSVLTADLAATSLSSIASGATATLALVFNVGSNAVRGLRVDLDFGSSWTAGSGLNGAGKNVVVSEIDLRLAPGMAVGVPSGSLPTPDLRPIFAELLFCERYYNTSYGHPAYEWIGTCAVTSLPLECVCNFPTVMRATPTVVLTNAFNQNFPATVGTPGNVSPTGFTEARTPATANTAAYFASSYTASAEL